MLIVKFQKDEYFYNRRYCIKNSVLDGNFFSRLATEGKEGAGNFLLQEIHYASMMFTI
jgi:hypothetical protein